MKIYELAKRVANFVWDFDPYNARDIYDSFGEAVSETIIGLSSKVQRKGIALYLESIIEENYETEYAKELLKEVNAL